MDEQTAFGNGRDPLGALMPGDQPQVGGAAVGPLSGVTFLAKDIIDVAGFVTSAGNPDWARSHGPAAAHAWAVQRMLDQGATLTGKAVTVEMAYSILGENPFYGTPSNPNAPGRVPGGSSSGSAAGVAGGLATVALGSDTGGSVRIPAAFCGIHGLRPTHGAVSLEGVFPLAATFDTLGWFARDAAMLGRVGAALLPADGDSTAFARLLIATDAFDRTPPEVRQPLLRAAERVARLLARHETAMAPEGVAGGFNGWFEAFRILQSVAFAAQHRAWIKARNPRFSAEIGERVKQALAVPAESAGPQEAARAAVRDHLEQLLGADGLLCLPTAPCPAPPLGLAGEAAAKFRKDCLSLTAAAGLAGLPQISLPLAEIDGLPLGLGLIAPRGRDRALLAFAAKVERLPAGA